MIRRPALIVVLALLTSNAHAQETDADRLFREGQEAMTAKDYANACAKFAASLQLEPGIGTRLWLADCYEQQGRLATAWRVFRETAAIALESKDSRATVAESRAAKLEPNLARIVVRVNHPPKNFELRLDGVRVQWSAPLFVDRGRHEVRSNTGYERVVDVEANGRSYDVTIDFAPPGSAPAPGEKQVPTAWPIAGFALVAGGAVGLGIGGYFGLRAKSQYDDAAPRCPSTCDTEGYDARNAAFRSATASTVLMVAGGALAVAGVTVLLVAPKKKTEPAPSMSLQLGPGTFALAGAF